MSPHSSKVILLIITAVFVVVMVTHYDNIALNVLLSYLIIDWWRVDLLALIEPRIPKLHAVLTLNITTIVFKIVITIAALCSIYFDWIQLLDDTMQHDTVEYVVLWFCWSKQVLALLFVIFARIAALFRHPTTKD